MIASRLSLGEYLARVFAQEGETEEDVGGAAVLRVLDLLRIPNVEGPTRAELAANAEVRAAWVEAAKLLENERAQRLAYAIRYPGVRLEEALSQDASTSLEDAVEAALRQTDLRLSGNA